MVLGGLLTGAVSLWQVQLTTRREREIRQTLREQERKDRREAFQRETLLALQDAVEDARHSVNQDFELALRNWAAKDRVHWVPRGPGDPLPEGWSDADARINKFWARVFDIDLQSSVEDFRLAMNVALSAGSPDDAFNSVNDVDTLARQVNSRIGVLLQELF